MTGDAAGGSATFPLLSVLGAEWLFFLSRRVGGTLPKGFTMDLLLLLEGDASPGPEAPGTPFELSGALNWALMMGVVLCAIWIVCQVARFVASRLDGRREPEHLARCVPALVGMVVLAGVQLVVPYVAGSITAEPQDAPDDPPVVPAPSGPAAPAPDEPMDWTPFVAGGVIIAGLVGLALLGLIALRTRHQIVDRKAAALDREVDWHAARAIFDQTRTKFADYLADPYAVFERPILDDHTDTLTAAFLTALADAEALYTETVPRSAQRIDEFRTAATAVAAAWSAADQNARTIGMGVLTDAERKTLTTIQKALGIALDESATAAEREAAMRTVTRLAGALPVAVNTDRIVQKLTLSLESVQRKALTM